MEKRRGILDIHPVIFWGAIGTLLLTFAVVALMK